MKGGQIIIEHPTVPDIGIVTFLLFAVIMANGKIISQIEHVAFVFIEEVFDLWAYEF